jgi:cobalt-zinc-cadmium resistance protein CzcA
VPDGAPVASADDRSFLGAVVGWSLRHRALVLVVSAALTFLGARALVHLPLDAFPDTTPVQVQINTVAPALSPEEIEAQITIPVEQAVAGIPRLADVRSISKFGLSQVTATFRDGTDPYFARQLLLERLSAVELPEGVARPEMGPIATGLGEIYHYLVTGEGWTLRDLTTLHDWSIKPRLLSVPGVAEVNTWGGERKQFHVVCDPARLAKHGLAFDDLFDALRENNRSVGGGYIEKAGEMHLVQGTGLATTPEQIAAIAVTSKGGVPVLVRDVAEVREGHEIRRGAATANGRGEVVLGLGFMLSGENSHDVAARLAARMDEIRPTLPPGVEVREVYLRTELVDRVLHTVQESLAGGAILVVAVLFLFLGDLRAGLVVASVIPLSMLAAAGGMIELGIAGSLMSLGAIDFGLLVDSAVIMVENAVRRLREAGPGARVVEVVRRAAVEVRRPTLFGELIIAVVFLPVLTLEGIEGRMFRPTAATLLLALGGSFVLSLTLVPVLAGLALRPGRGEGTHWSERFAERFYRPVVRRALARPGRVLAATLALVVAGGLLATRLGATFVPRLSEMAVVANMVRLAGVSLEESVRYGGRVEAHLLAKFPDEVRDVWVRTGTAEVATDPMGIELSDAFVTLKPRSEWRRARTQEELVQRMEEELAQFPGMRVVFTQPIEMRINEMIAGIRTDVGVKIFGDDLDSLRVKAEEVNDVLASIPGVADAYVEQITGQPVLRVEVDRDAIARHGVSAAHVLEVVEALGGVTVGEVRDGPRRFDLAVRLAERYRRDPEEVGRILIPTASGARIPLGRLAKVRQEEGASTITHEWQRRRIVVQCNVRGRDVAGFVADVRERLKEDLELPPGWHVEIAGQFEHLERAQARLRIVVPLALLLIGFLLHMSLGSVRDAALVFTAAPLAAVGGVIALLLRGLPFTISAGIGFVAVSGVAMLAGLVLVSTVRRMEGEGVPTLRAIEDAAVLRLRPVLMTTLVASLGFVPMALNTGVGAEVQRPLATVVIGGVVAANLLTLVVLPALLRRVSRS